MKALRFVENQLRLSDVPVPDGNDEVLVRVLKSGICNTDLEIVRGYAGFEGTLGHEFVGLAENGSLVGKRVVGEINAGCGACELCMAGDSRHCPLRTVLGIKGRDGAHAEFLALPERNLTEVPDGVTDEQAVFTEPLAAAFGITEQVEILPETKVAVIGDGKLGILCALSLALKSKNLVLVGKHKSKLAIAKEQGVEGMLPDEARKMSANFDVVVEASGSESGFATALDLVRPRGKIVLKSTFHGKPSWEAWRVVVDEVSIIGSRCGRFEPALSLLAERKIDVSGLVSEEFTLAEGVKAFDVAGSKGVMKVLLTM